MEVGTPVSMATRTGPAECPQYIMEEEYTVGVPLVSTKIGQTVTVPYRNQFIISLVIWADNCVYFCHFLKS